ncbi:twin-arginine translocation signal domain-containing protein [Mesorhizobium sp. WSM2561]|uniref:twin-arginine translocation signal domain-containing protein n=1 Tax=Mesorhizobium sp. WSM2561 TaxID=1040985 RepID=UPI0012EC618B|nr:twin-arginine translocation signal domain-containing protein [Mesorhizobium sp. WSM2561]
MKDDRGEANCGSAQGEPSQALSRRKFLKVSMTGAALAGAGGLASCMTGQPTARGAGTTPKPVALYQNSPNKGRRCGGCKHFLEPNACGIVAGEISPNGWCRFYEPLPA